MAGHRQKTGAPHALVVRHARRRASFDQRVAAAQSPAEQVAAACGYATSLLIWLTRRDPAAAADAGRRIVAAIATVSDDLVAAVERNQR